MVPSTYNSSNSNTSRLQKGHTWSTCYLDQSWVAGEVYIENVSAGGITVKNQIIGVARRINSQIQLGNGREGVLGLSFNSRNSIGMDWSLNLSVKLLLNKAIDSSFQEYLDTLLFSIMSNQLCLPLGLLQT